jgi:hypothetical protein
VGRLAETEATEIGMNLVQMTNGDLQRRVAAVEGDRLRLVSNFDSIYRLALLALDRQSTLTETIGEHLSDFTLDYDEVYSGESDWSLLPCFDHPDERARCLVSGTGLTHLASAKNRDSMHAEAQAKPLTDSMRMYQSGVEGGRPAEGSIGVAPEWFYKGTGAALRAHSEPLDVPWFAGDGGEEPEIAGAYLIDWSGQPRRIGLTVANEFSDHVTERQNYLYLAHSKLRSCSIGPELVIEPDFSNVRGEVRILRGSGVVWSETIASGDANMCHSLANIEHHHFKYAAHRQPGDVHIHFFGASAFSFGAGIRLQEGDIMEVAFEGFGRPLRNPLAVDHREASLVRVSAI